MSAMLIVDGGMPFECQLQKSRVNARPYAIFTDTKVIWPGGGDVGYGVAFAFAPRPIKLSLAELGSPTGVRMHSITTTKCHDNDHPELVLGFDPAAVLETDALWFAGTLEQMVQSGSRFQEGQSLQIGWSVAWFVALPNGNLGFEEPDMKRP